MPIPAQTPEANYTADGIATSYAYAFRIFAASDLVVTVAGAVKTLNVDYTVSGVNSPSGGSVVFTTPPAASAAVKLLRNIPIDRATDYTTAGPNRAQTMDDDLDRATAQKQDMHHRLTQAEIDVEDLQSRMDAAESDIDTNAAAIAQEVTARQAAVASEAASREAADDAETTARIAADNAEATARAAADNALAAQVGSIWIGSLTAGDVSVGNYAALRAMTPPASGKGTAILQGRTTSGDGGGGVFRWASENQSANVTADPQSGIYVAPNTDLTGAGGCWVRQFSGAIFIEWFGAVADYDTATKTGTDNLAALQGVKALVQSLSRGGLWASGEQESEGVRITSGRGTFGLSAPMDWGTISVTLDFSGTFQTVFAAISGFPTSTPLFRLGSKTAQVLTKQMTLRNCSFNCAAIAGVRGVEFYGLRDGSEIRNLFVSGFTETAVYSDFAGQLGGAYMSEGVILENIHALSFVHIGGTIFDFGGLFESTILGGKALLNGVSRGADATGYRIGRTECRGVNLQGVSVGNLIGAGVKVGIAYENAVDCWDNESTFEHILGVSVVFGHTQTASLCKSLMGRHYNPAAIAQQPYKFNLSNTCVAVMGSASAASTAATFETGATNSHFEVKIVNGTIAQVKSNVVKFNGGTGNSAKGYATTNQAFWGLSGTDFSKIIGSNETFLQFDQFWTTFRMGTQNKLRIQDSAGNTMVTIDGTNNSVQIHSAAVSMPNLPASTATPGFLYKDGTGTLKIAP